METTLEYPGKAGRSVECSSALGETLQPFFFFFWSSSKPVRLIAAGDSMWSVVTDSEHKPSSHSTAGKTSSIHETRKLHEHADCSQCSSPALWKTQSSSAWIYRENNTDETLLWDKESKPPCGPVPRACLSTSVFMLNKAQGLSVVISVSRSPSSH